MKVDYISDIHLDFWIKELNVNSDKFRNELKTFIETVQIKGGEVLIIAGDLGHYVSQIKEFLLKMKELYRYVLFVHGNHDMYLVSNKQQFKYNYHSVNRLMEMKIFCRANDIHYLDGTVTNINGYNFGGVAMSWDKSFANQFFGSEQSNEDVFKIFKEISDSRYIFESKFTVEWNPFKYFKEQYEKLQEMEPVDVMISHYTPIVPPNLPEEFNNKISTLFSFDGFEELKRINPKYWIFGHNHFKSNFNINNTNLLSNPLGYPSENTYCVIESFELGLN